MRELDKNPVPEVQLKSQGNPWLGLTAQYYTSKKIFHRITTCFSGEFSGFSLTREATVRRPGDPPEGQVFLFSKENERERRPEQETR